MKPVVDDRGNLISGLFRAPNGSLVVKDDEALTKYKTQLRVVTEQHNKIEQLTNDVEALKSLVSRLLERQ